jgi:hypothetical protein
MSKEDPSARDDAAHQEEPAHQEERSDEPADGLDKLSDEGLLAALGVLLSQEPPPAWSVEAAKSSYDLRTVDAELAALISDSGLAGTRSAVRSAAGPRLAVFGTADLSVEIEIEPGASSGMWRLIGQLTPAAPARIQIRQQGAPAIMADADALGRFAADHLTGRPLSLVCLRDGRRAAVTEWIAIGLVRTRGRPGLLRDPVIEVGRADQVRILEPVGEIDSRV